MYNINLNTRSQPAIGSTEKGDVYYIGSHRNQIDKPL